MKNSIIWALESFWILKEPLFHLIMFKYLVSKKPRKGYHLKYDIWIPSSNMVPRKTRSLFKYQASNTPIFKAKKNIFEQHWNIQTQPSSLKKQRLVFRIEWNPTTSNILFGLNLYITFFKCNHSLPYIINRKISEWNEEKKKKWVINKSKKSWQMP